MKLADGSEIRLTPVAYTDLRYNRFTGKINPIDFDKAELADLINEKKICRWVPQSFCEDHSESSMTLKSVSSDQFVRDIQAITKQVYKEILGIFGKRSQICLNLASLVTNYIHEKYGFPVVGLFRESDSNLEFYVRPVITLFDRRVCYPEFASEKPIGIEALNEIKINDKLFALDFNFFYDTKSPEKSKVLLEEICTPQQLAKYGLHRMQYSGFKEEDLCDEDVHSYLDHYTSGQFAVMMGDPDTNDATGPSKLKVREYIKKLSHGALITNEGFEARDITANGRIWLPTSFDERMLLHKLLD